MTERTALVTGASGYVGGQLVPRLLAEGWRVRVLTRRAASLAESPWRDRVEVVEGDAASEKDLERALAEVDVAYYLIHSMGRRSAGFVDRDRALVGTFARAADRCAVERLVYLGGLHPPDIELSDHLASRVEVGEVLLQSSVPAAVLQAAVIIGAGSASFDMMRYLAERLPVMVAPRWLNNRVQPIAIDDVLGYLVAAADLPPDANRTFDIGGPDVLTYSEMLQRFAGLTGRRRRLIVTVPVLTPRLASYWVALVTPVEAGLAKPLVRSLEHEVICRENDLDAALPDHGVNRLGFDDAVRRAMADVVPRRRSRA